MFAAPVRLRDEIDVAFVFDLRRARVFFSENFTGFESGPDGNVQIGLGHVHIYFSTREKDRLRRRRDET